MKILFCLKIGNDKKKLIIGKLENSILSQFKRKIKNSQNSFCWWNKTNRFCRRERGRAKLEREDTSLQMQYPFICWAITITACYGTVPSKRPYLLLFGDSIFNSEIDAQSEKRKRQTINTPNFLFLFRYNFVMSVKWAVKYIESRAHFYMACIFISNLKIPTICLSSFRFVATMWLLYLYIRRRCCRH